MGRKLWENIIINPGKIISGWEQSYLAFPKLPAQGKRQFWTVGEAPFGSKHLEGSLSILEIQLTVAWQLRLQKDFPSKQQAEGSSASQAVNNPSLRRARGARGEFLTTPFPKIAQAPRGEAREDMGSAARGEGWWDKAGTEKLCLSFPTGEPGVRMGLQKMSFFSLQISSPTWL